MLYLANGMATYFAVRHTTIDPVEIDALLKEIYGQGRHLRNIVLAVGYRERASSIRAPGTNRYSTKTTGRFRGNGDRQERHRAARAVC